MRATVKKSIDLNDFDHSQWDGTIWVYPPKKVVSHFDYTVRSTGRKEYTPRRWADLIKEGGR